MELSNSPLGVRRRLKIVGFIEWDDVEKFLICKFFIESIDPQGNLLTDKVINQSREIRYPLTNSNRVNAQFNPVSSGGTGEYDFFFNYLQTNLLVPSYMLLATKLNERGLFD